MEIGGIVLFWFLFGASHMALSSLKLRPKLVGVLGNRGFQGVYSLVALGTFVPLVRIYADAKHPYTRALLSAVPMPDPDAKEKKQRVILQGDVPSPINPPSGCSFHPRCAFAERICGEEEPALERTDDGHLVACHVFGPGANK